MRESKKNCGDRTVFNVYFNCLQTTQQSRNALKYPKVLPILFFSICFHYKIMQTHYIKVEKMKGNYI